MILGWFWDDFRDVTEMPWGYFFVGTCLENFVFNLIACLLKAALPDRAENAGRSNTTQIQNQSH